MPRSPLALLVALAAIAGAAPARAALLIQAPTALGSDYRLTPSSATLDPRLLAGNDARPGGYVDDAGTKFALGTALPTGATITSATLAFAVPLAYSAGGDASSSVLAVSGSASATTTLSLADFGAATANVAEAVVSTTFPGTEAPAAFTFNVTSLVALLYAGGSAAVFFQFDDLTSQTTMQLAPYLGSGTAPTLTIQFTPAAATVPEPASGLLAALGLAGALCAARRRPAEDVAAPHRVG